MTDIHTPDADYVPEDPLRDKLGSLEVMVAPSAAANTAIISPEEAAAIMRDARKRTDGTMGPLMRKLAH